MHLEDFVDIREVESVRSDWHQADCEISDCTWYTTGSEYVCEMAAYEHLEEYHPRRARGAY